MTEVDQQARPLKPGVRTTEFWVTLLVSVATTVLGATGELDPETAATLVGGVASVYTVARQYIKARTK